MKEKQFLSRNYLYSIDSGSTMWSSPSNIALVKYWGKKEHQIPENQSISFTLNSCKTETNLVFERRKEPANNFSFEVIFENEKNSDFKPKIETFFKRIERYLPFLKTYHFTIQTSNTFPHSSGIASSASGMSALALCLMSVEKQLIQSDKSLSEAEKFFDADYFNKKASFLSRLGSGSACRSISGPIVVWGEHEAIKESSDLYGVEYSDAVHPNFLNYQDTILLVDKGEKQVSSTVGHNLMHGHPFAKERFKQAKDTIFKIKHILKSGDLNKFIDLVESEALTLHAMMMTSMPYFILMKPNTLEIINKIWAFRAQTGLHVAFTLDAGANVHVLYPENEAKQINEFISTELVAYCQNGHFICDRVGFGAKEINR